MIALPADTEMHPGLLLDKWHECWQTSSPKDFQRKQLERVTKAHHDEVLLSRVRQRLEKALAQFKLRAGSIEPQGR